MRCAVGFAYDVCSTNDATLDTFSYPIERGIEVVIPDNTLKNRNMTLYQERHTRKAVVMNHGNSGLAHGTSGSPQLTLENGEMAEKANELALKEIKNTSEVWKHIEATHPHYAGTPIPRSFTIDTPAGKMWAHGNATEHMYEAMIATKATAPKLLNSNPNLYSQFILYDYWKTLGKSVSNGIQYEKIRTIGRWELIFSKPRKEGDKPVVKHSKFLGL